MDKTRKIPLRHVEGRGTTKKKNRGRRGDVKPDRTGHIEKTSRRISYRLLEDYGPTGECLFIIFNSIFDDDQLFNSTFDAFS